MTQIRRRGVEERLPDESQSAVQPALARVGAIHQSLRDVIESELRRGILAGVYVPGERLVEDKLAERYGVSRNPVREALRVLQSEGLVEVTPRKGATVTRLSHAEAREIIELRASLEGLCARLAARRRSNPLSTQIRGVVAQGEAAASRGDIDTVRLMNDEYHALVAKAGANRYLEDFVRSLRARTHWLFVGTDVERTRASWREHAAILIAIDDGDQELAGLLASRHVTNAGGVYLEAVGWSKEAPESD